MSDVATFTEEQIAPVPEGRKEFTVDSNNLASNMWGVEPAPTPWTPPEKKEEPKVAVAEPPKVEAVVEQPAAPTTTWINEFGWENEDAAKAEIKKLKEQTPAEVKFENEQSKQIYELLKDGKQKEVREFLDMQNKFDKYLSSDVDKNTAEDIIKLSMQAKHKDLSDAEINYKYNKEFGSPKEPIQGNDELDEDFEERTQTWKSKVADIEMNRVIEAKLLKPELEKQKTQLILPELSGQAIPKVQTQEELDAAKKYADAYIQDVDNSIKAFNGFSVAVKHEGVDLPITYGVTEEEKTSIAGQLKDFQKSNYDANVLFANRWVGEDGQLKPEQMIKDLSVLNNYEKAFQKFASDSSSKVLEAYLKGKKNININELNQQGTSNIIGEQKTELDAVRDSFFGG